MNKIKQFFKDTWDKIWKVIEFPYYYITNASWFVQLSNRKIIKLEVFYLLISIAIFLVTWGIGDGVAKGLEFHTTFYILCIPFFILWLLKVITIFGYKVRKAVQDYYWETQLMRFLDPSYRIPLALYPNAEERITKLKEMWELKYGVTVEWTRANAPLFLKLRIIIMLGAAFLGIAFGYYF